MSCMDCKFLIIIENGYSNYTIEERNIDCLKGQNKDFPVDMFYGAEPAVKYAEQCELFVPGKNTEVDVDRECGSLRNYNDDEDIKILLDEYEESHDY